MILDVLKNFSEGELLKLLPENSVIFSRKVLQDFKKSNIAEAVLINISAQLVLKKHLRDKIIERLSKEQIERIIKKVKPEYKYSDSAYNELKNYANLNTDKFAELLGLAQEIKDELYSKAKIAEVECIKPCYPVYAYQAQITECVKNWINEPLTERCLIHLPTGAGKTRTAINTACEYLRSHHSLVIWLCDSNELCEQASKEFKRAWAALGNRNLNVYSMYDDAGLDVASVNDGFLVASLQRFNIVKAEQEEFVKRTLEKLRDRVTLVIFDEAHKAIAPTYRETVEFLLARKNDDDRKFLIGLTATPGRKINYIDQTENINLANFFQNRKITMQVKGYSSPVQFLVDSGYLSIPDYIPLKYSGSTKNQLDIIDSNEVEILNRLAEIDERNASIISVVKDEYANGSCIIVFACSVQHSQNLAISLCCMGINAASLDSSNDTSSSRRRKIEAFRDGKIRVLVNYGILTTGFDAPKTDVAVIARPTKSLVLYSQMAGRAMRGPLNGGTKHARIYIVDDEIPEYKNVNQAFLHWNECWDVV